MAGNIQADTSGDIYVEFDYNNIIVVDPNKTQDALGNISERLVDHENLVMYANLEADVLPRTKLAAGGSPEDRIRTISVAKINFLKPTKNSYLGTGYYDQLTGSNSTQFNAENQPKEVGIKGTDGQDAYIRNTVVDETNIIDNGLLGITSINITTNTSFIPSVEILLEDVQGKGLFELGNNSPYSAFFNLPYPQFYLTLKGYYGQAVRYQLNLEKFHASFNGFSGNYLVRLQFKGYKFNILNEVAMGHLLAAPHMYSQRFDISQTVAGPQQSNNSAESQASTQAEKGANNLGSNQAVVTQIVAEKGYQKIVEVYSEYKAKGLIDPNFPELTLVQLMNKLETFEQNIVNSFDKTEVESLTNIRNYKGILTQYFNRIRAANNSWFNTYLNTKPIVLIGNKNLYVFKDLSQSVKDTAISELNGDIVKFNSSLAENPTLGIKGTDSIPNPIKTNMIVIVPPPIGEIDWRETTRVQTGIANPTEEDVLKTQNLYAYLWKPVIEQSTFEGKKIYNQVPQGWFVFEGDGKFDKEISLLETQANKKLSDYESKISAALLRKIEDTATGIGFTPTVRNIIAVIMASTEGFIRLLDDVHTNAWNVKYDPVRKKAILDNPASAPSSETVDQVVRDSANLANQNQLDDIVNNSEIPVYPWPQYFVESPDDKKGRFQLKYLADPTVVDTTQGYLFDKWPEVEFVEEYMKGLTQKFQNPSAPPPLDSERDTNIININAIEYPSTGIPYTNKEEVKFFYEIWERQFLTSHYSGLVRANLNQVDELIKLNIETEVNNLVSKLGLSSPYLTLKLKNFNLDATNYPDFLRTISNSGTGRAYQDYIRDFFVTPYIKGITENSFAILNALDLGKIPQVATKSDALRLLLNNASNTPLIVDTLPYTDSTWCLNNLNQGNSSVSNQVYSTSKSLTIFEPRKIISNFTDVYDYTTNRPVTNFSYLLNSNPSVQVSTDGALNSGNDNLTLFFLQRTPDNFIATEGLVDGFVPAFTGISSVVAFRRTTSMLNTPYFVNAIQNGVYNSRISGNNYPYVQAAYLFLNSLPLATLREKYKSVSNDVVSELDYISSSLKKFGAIHKLPYAWILKYGSIWHRYKKYKESNVDILQSAWNNFDYAGNYYPPTSSTTQTYSFKYSELETNIQLQSETDSDIKMQVGFYPKLINDFSVFYNGYDLYQNYTDTEIQNSVNAGMKIYNFSSSNIVNAKQGDKSLRLNTWSVLLPNLSPEVPIDCNPKDNTKGGDYFVIPSFGTPFNQTVNSCIQNLTTTPSTVVDLTNNSSVFNGSVRCLWPAPNFGYFDNNQITFPEPDSYLNFITTGSTFQTPLHFLTQNTYTKIEEVFSVFEKKILDVFELEFLNFCKPISNASVSGEVSTFGQSTVNLNANFKNFQSLFKSLMTVPSKVQGETDEQYFTNTINNQYSLFQSGIRSFMDYDIVFKYGNPSNYQRRIFDSYLSHNNTDVVVDPITFNPYVPNSLPQAGSNLTLSQSQANNRQAWLALETEVGFSTILNVRYSSLGSYITDFFIDNNIEFTSQNVTLLAPIIKMYATQKLNNPNISAAQFQNQLNQYLRQEVGLQNNFLNGVLTGVRRALPNQQQLPERVVNSVITGEQSKVENYEVFKALNDKWVAGGDYKTKTLFEDMLFLDRASRNIGDTILLDIFDLKAMFGVGGESGQYSLNQAMSVFTFISGILIKNNFTVMPLPAYVNFYNVQDVGGVATPKPEGSLEFANKLWGTFLDVDYRDSGPKMVCFYTGKPSQYLNLPKGNFRFRDDAFDMRRASENPLLEDQNGKTDYDKSNKCVGFNVDVGTRNQNIFYSFTVSQDNGVATSEAINTQLNMVDQASGRSIATQNNSLYNLYKNRSYKSSVTSLGNALIQPTMYFNVRHVPMFNGPYMITSVSHSIQPGSFQTTFEGIRQGIFDLPAIDSFLQSINQNLITKLEELLKINKDQVTVSATTNNVKATQVVQKADNTLDTTNSCTSKITDPVYLNGGYIAENGVSTKITPKELADALKRLIPNDPTLQTIIYCISYVRTFQPDANTKIGSFNAWNYNLSTISLETNLYGQVSQIQKTYSCVNVKTSPASNSSQPIAHFASLDSYVNFMSGRLFNNIERILRLGLVKYYVCYWPTTNIEESYYDSNIGTFKQTKDTMYEGLKSAVEAGLTDTTLSIEFKIKIEDTESKGKTPGVTPTPSPIPPNIGQTCPPPVVSTFSPAAGYTGTIVQVNGRNFESVKSITVAGQNVDINNITVFNKETLRFVLPAITIPAGQDVATGRITVTTEYGEFVTLVNFTFNPKLQNVTMSSAGEYADTTTQQQISLPQQEVISENMNPQQTGPPTFIDTTIQLNESKTQSLNVKINPELSGWVIGSNVDQNAQVYILEESNNQVTRKKVTQKIQGVGGQVTNNEFNITLSEIESFYLDGVPKIEGKTQIDIIFTVYAYKGAESPVKRQFPFRIWYTLPNQNQVPVENIPVNQTLPTFPQQQLSIVRLPDSDTIQGEGQTYYNIKKPSGGYITFNFTVPSGQSYQSQNRGGISILDNNYDIVPFNSFGNSGTRYTNEMTINSKGVFRLQIKYYPYGFTSPIDGEVLEQTVVSDIFTL
jgi:hypothetical protein